MFGAGAFKRIAALQLPPQGPGAPGVCTQGPVSPGWGAVAVPGRPAQIPAWEAEGAPASGRQGEEGAAGRHPLLQRAVAPFLGSPSFGHRCGRPHPHTRSPGTSNSVPPRPTSPSPKPVSCSPLVFGGRGGRSCAGPTPSRAAALPAPSLLLNLGSTHCLPCRPAPPAPAP